ncbi:hypothetical protein Tco_0887769 [Tanacetum coccineum]
MAINHSLFHGNTSIRFVFVLSANMVNSVVYHTHASPLPNFVAAPPGLNAGLVGYSSPSLVYHTTQVQPVHYGYAPPGFTYPTAQPNFYMVSLAQSTIQVGPLPDFSSAYLTTSPGQPLNKFKSTGPMVIPRQETTLPHAFSVMSLQDPTIGACNMDTCAGYHFNDSVTSLSDIFNMYIYPSILVGDGHSIPVTNTGRMFLSQRKYAVKILERDHMVNCNPNQTAVDTESKLGDDGDLCSSYFHPLLRIWLLIRMRIGLVALLLGDRLQFIVYSLATTYSLGPLSVTPRQGGNVRGDERGNHRNTLASI